MNTYLGRRLDEVSRVIREVRPHLAFLQELLIYRYRGWTWHQAESLAAELGMTCAYQRLVWRRGTEIGLAVLATGALRDAMPIEGPPDRPTGLSARADLGGDTISVAAVHCTSVPRPLIVGYPLVMRTHYRQVAWAIQRLEQLGGPAIMAGDFNTIAGTPAHRLACRYFNDTARQMGDRTGTRRTLGLPLRIDYIFASAHFQCEHYRVLKTEGSDHQPVTATLSWHDEAG
jgi:endonuclease/exonuclease/phosphatase family metal-dependent hydrolase